MPQLNYSRKNRPTTSRFSWRRMQRSLRRSFTRENCIEALKTCAWVVPLTILIWIYAEQEQLKVDPDISIPIAVRMDDPTRLVTLQKPYPNQVIVAKLSGSRADLDALESKLQRGANGELATQITVKSSLEPNASHSLPIAAELASAAPFRQSGVTISYCQPPEIVVNVEKISHEDLPVQVPPEATNVVGQPVFTPATVRVVGTESDLKKAHDMGKLFAYADLSNFNILRTPGTHDISGVPILTLPEFKSLNFVPTEVKATLSVRENDVRFAVAAMPVWVVGDADTIARFRVECSPKTISNVVLIGPPDKIKMLSRPDFSPKPRAVLEVKPSDDHDVTRQRQVRIELPPNMGLRVEDESSIRPIDFKVIDTRVTE